MYNTPKLAGLDQEDITSQGNKNKLKIIELNGLLEDSVYSNSNRKEASCLCRICFQAYSDVSDPLISPCKCAGSMGYIHYKCLKQCISVKINKKEGDNYVCYNWKNFECEICLQEYPKYIKYKNITYSMVDVIVSFEQFMIMDYTLFDDAKKKSFRKGMIVVKIEDDVEVTIGRTQTNTIKLKDISVSRTHCCFIKQNNKIYICDKGSKFGTLIYMNKPYLISKKDGPRLLQDSYCAESATLITGKNYFDFKLTNSWNLFSGLFSNPLCCKCKSTNDEEVVLSSNDVEEAECTKIRENNLLNDSYNDYVINLDTIIRFNENNNSYI